MIIRIICAVCALGCSLSLSSQEFWGAGNSDSITVTSSSTLAPDQWTRTASPDKTINGAGLDARIFETGRFLSQATMGVSPDETARIAEMDFEDWIDEQFEEDEALLLDQIDDTYSELIDWYVGMGRDSSEFGMPSWVQFNYAWWTSETLEKDYLRRKITQALSEIFVVSINSGLSGMGQGLASYHDVLYRNAFGNYRDLLREVTLHPCMGHYLSHLNNPKSDTTNNIRPDQNYAREVIQLFSIGLFELENNGQEKLDGQGNPISTYGQEVIGEFAKIFTGLGVSAIRENQWLDSAAFDVGIYLADLTKPMKMYEEWHEPGEKFLFDGEVVPSGQGGMQDIEDALDNIFMHPNVGPFIGRTLIQRLVKSNPTPDYIQRVALAFNDNGRGVRGDFKAVIKAILLDPEARDCSWLSEVDAARLRPPLYRYTHFAKSIQPRQAYGRYWNVNYTFWDRTGMSPFWAPSVFNFYPPSYQPPGELGERGLEAPEFLLHNTKQSIGFINQANNWTAWNNLMSGWEEEDPGVTIDVDRFKEFAQDPETLLNELDKLYTHGELTDHTREVVKEAISELVYNRFREDRVRLAMYLIVMSPDYAIIR